MLLAASASNPWHAQQAALAARLPLAALGPDDPLARPLPSGGEQHSPPLCPDESDYQTEYEEELPDGPKDAYADFQSAPAHVGSDSVSCPHLPVPLG